MFSADTAVKETTPRPKKKEKETQKSKSEEKKEKGVTVDVQISHVYSSWHVPNIFSPDGQIHWTVSISVCACSRKFLA